MLTFVNITLTFGQCQYHVIGIYAMLTFGTCHVTRLEQCLSLALSAYPSAPFCALGILQSTGIRDGMPADTYN
jgi:hypothetical protein